MGKQLAHLGLPVHYEPCRFKYEPLKKVKSYTPDFILPNGIVIETKGRFVSADRQKHKALKQQYPNLDIRFVFSNSRQRITKGSKTTYAAWCEKHGFEYADKLIPIEWAEASTRIERLDAIREARND